MTLRKFVDAGVLLAIGFLVGMMVADVSSAEHFASEWQTLIAGILAVIAAAWTVGEMKRTDRNQHERHMELVAQGDRERRRQLGTIAFYWAVVENNAEQYRCAFDSFGRAGNAVERAQALAAICAANDVAKMNVFNANFISNRQHFSGQLAMSYASAEKLILGLDQVKVAILEGKLTPSDHWFDKGNPWIVSMGEHLDLAMSVLAIELKKLDDGV